MSLLANARGLYVIVDPAHVRGRAPQLVAEAALACRPVALQLRAKAMRDAELLALARDLRALCARAGVPFVMNDRADLAVLVRADAVHLGQGDLTWEEASRVAPGLPVGRSTHSLAQAHQAVSEGADHLGYGPVFATTSKENPDPTVGLASLRAMADSIRIPWIAIGGITMERIDAVRDAGARIAAVVGAVGLADDPAAAAAALHARMQGITGDTR